MSVSKISDAQIQIRIRFDMVNSFNMHNAYYMNSQNQI